MLNRANYGGLSDGFGAMKKKKKAKRWTSWHFRPFRLTLMFWVLLLVIYMFPIGIRTFWDTELFWYFEYEIYCVFPFLAALLLSYVTPIIWIWRTHQYWLPHISKANLIVLGIFGILVLGGIALPSQRGPHYLATTRTDDHIYYLGYIESRIDFSLTVSFYKCDHLGLFCTRLCEYPMGSIHHKEEFGLRSDAQAQSVTITLNNQPLCTYSEKSWRVQQIAIPVPIE